MLNPKYKEEITKINFISSLKSLWKWTNISTDQQKQRAQIKILINEKDDIATDIAEIKKMRILSTSLYK